MKVFRNVFGKEELLVLLGDLYGLLGKYSFFGDVWHGMEITEADLCLHSSMCCLFLTLSYPVGSLDSPFLVVEGLKWYLVYLACFFLTERFSEMCIFLFPNEY